MKSGPKIWSKVAAAQCQVKAIGKLKDGALRSLLSWLLKNVAPDDPNSMALGLALVESAERFRRGGAHALSKISKRRIL